MFQIKLLLVDSRDGKIDRECILWQDDVMYKAVKFWRAIVGFCKFLEVLAESW